MDNLTAYVSPHLPPLFNATPESVLNDAKTAIARTEEVWDEIISNVPFDQASIENTILPVAHNENEMRIIYDLVYLYATTHPSREMRDASKEGKRLADEAEIDRYNRADMFSLVDSILRKTQEASVDPEMYRFLVKHHAQFLDNGCDLPEDKRADFQKNLKELQGLVRAYASNLDEDTSGMWLEAANLEDLPTVFLDKLEKGEGQFEGKYWVKMKASNHESLMRFCSSEETRMSFFIGYQNRMHANVTLARDIVLLRDSLARQRGYDSWALLKLANKMITHPSIILETLEKIRPGLQKIAKHEAGELLALKKALGSASDQLYLWDISFYHNRQQEMRQLDTKLSMEYFELHTVVRKALSLYEKLFGIRFELVDEKTAQTLHGQRACHVTWQDDVLLYLVWDNSEEDQAFLGWLYFDLYSREGKHSHHAAHFAFRKGFERRDGTRSHPASVLVVNQTKSLDSKPSLLTVDQVRGIFHEVGHGMHNLLSKTRFARMHGTKVDRDFAETPSLLFEHFLWQPENLRAISCHYSRVSEDYQRHWQTAHPNEELTQKHLPEALVSTIISSSESSNALKVLKQLHYTFYDLAIHNPSSRSVLETMDLCEVYNKLWVEFVPVTGGEALGKGFHWGHGESIVRAFMCGSYDAGYYAYILGRVWAVDIFGSFFAGNTNSSEAGRRCREMLLEPGGSQSERKTLRQYLGREPDSSAYLRWLGLDGK